MVGLCPSRGVSFVTLKNMFFETRTCKEIYGLVALLFLQKPGMFGASLLELFKGEPFSKAQKHHCFCGQGAGNTLINQGGFCLLWGGWPLKGGVLCVF